jgi:protein-tyrosine phosphatase
MPRLLFVCLGNICRSPAGENVMNHLLEREGLAPRFEVDSAGTAGYHIGNPPDARMTKAARERGIAMKGRARQVNPADFEEFDWIFAMDRSNHEDLQRVRQKARNPTARLVLFCEFCERHGEREVARSFSANGAMENCARSPRDRVSFDRGIRDSAGAGVAPSAVPCYGTVGPFPGRRHPR